MLMLLPGFSFIPLPTSGLKPGSSIPWPALKSGMGVALTGADGVGMIGVVASGQGEAVTLPCSVVPPQPHRTRLRIMANTRYAKALFIFILLSVMQSYYLRLSGNLYVKTEF